MRDSGSPAAIARSLSKPAREKLARVKIATWWALDVGERLPITLTRIGLIERDTSIEPFSLYRITKLGLEVQEELAKTEEKPHAKPT